MHGVPDVLEIGWRSARCRPVLDRPMGEFQGLEVLGEFHDVQGRDEGAAVGQDRDQAVGRQPDQRFAHRSPGHLQFVDDARFVDLGAGRQLEAQDHVAKMLVDQGSTLTSRLSFRRTQGSSGCIRPGCPGCP